MKKADIQVGGVYVAKISGHLVPVRLEAVSSLGGWTGRNLATNREVRIRSAAKLRRATADPARGPIAVRDRTPVADEHRARFPEQYAHPLVGTRVAFAYGGGRRAGVVRRVFMTRFGQLAAISSIPPREAIAVAALEPHPACTMRGCLACDVAAPSPSEAIPAGEVVVV